VHEIGPPLIFGLVQRLENERDAARMDHNVWRVIAVVALLLAALAVML